MALPTSPSPLWGVLGWGVAGSGTREPPPLPLPTRGRDKTFPISPQSSAMSLLARNNVGARGIELRGPTRFDDDGGRHFLDDGGTGDQRARPQFATVIDRCLAGFAGGLEDRLAVTF